MKARTERLLSDMKINEKNKPRKNSVTQKILTHAFINLSKSMVSECYKKHALASKDEGPAEIGRAAGRGRVVLIWRPRVPPHSPLPYSTPYGPRTQADISEALAPAPPCQ